MLEKDKVIERLEEKLNNVKHELNNHYHELPTTGMRLFESKHPYYINS